MDCINRHRRRFHEGETVRLGARAEDDSFHRGGSVSVPWLTRSVDMSRVDTFIYQSVADGKLIPMRRHLIALGRGRELS